jgi:TATA-binding protein-associated factor Taf7
MFTVMGVTTVVEMGVVAGGELLDALRERAPLPRRGGEESGGGEEEDDEDDEDDEEEESDPDPDGDDEAERVWRLEDLVSGRHFLDRD